MYSLTLFLNPIFLILMCFCQKKTFKQDFAKLLETKKVDLIHCIPK